MVWVNPGHLHVTTLLLLQTKVIFFSVTSLIFVQFPYLHNWPLLTWVALDPELDMVSLNDRLVCFQLHWHYMKNSSRALSIKQKPHKMQYLNFSDIPLCVCPGCWKIKDPTHTEAKCKSVNTLEALYALSLIYNSDLTKRTLKFYIYMCCPF